MESSTSICKSLQKTIIKFQEEQLNYGDFYAQWLKCKLSTENIVAENIGSESSLKFKIGSTLLKSLEKITSKLLSNESLNACIFLDSRFQHILTANKRSDAICYLKLLWDRMKRKNTNTNASQNLPTLEPTEIMVEEDQMLYQCLSAQTYTIDVDVKLNASYLDMNIKAL